MKVKGKLRELILSYPALWRWAIVGTSTAAIDYFLFLYLYSVLFTVLISNLISGFAALSFNYIMHYFWSFKSQNNHKQSGIRFMLNLVVIWSIGTLLLKILIILEIEPYIAKLIPILITAPGSFFSLKYFVFKSR